MSLIFTLHRIGDKSGRLLIYGDNRESAIKYILNNIEVINLDDVINYLHIQSDNLDNLKASIKRNPHEYLNTDSINVIINNGYVLREFDNITQLNFSKP